MKEANIADDYSADVRPGSDGWAALSTVAGECVFLDVATLFFAKREDSDDVTAFSDAYLDPEQKKPEAYSSTPGTDRRPWRPASAPREFAWNCSLFHGTAEVYGIDSLLCDHSRAELERDSVVAVRRTWKYNRPQCKLEHHNLQECRDPCIIRSPYRGYRLEPETLVVKPSWKSGMFKAYATVTEAYGDTRTDDNVSDALGPGPNNKFIEFDPEEATFTVTDYLREPDSEVPELYIRRYGGYVAFYPDGNTDTIQYGVVEDSDSWEDTGGVFISSKRGWVRIKVPKEHVCWVELDPTNAPDPLFEEFKCSE